MSTTPVRPRPSIVHDTGAVSAGWRRFFRSTQGRVVFGVTAPALLGAIAGLAIPRGPSTAAQAVVMLAAGAAAGAAAGFVLRSRWALLAAPMVHVAVVELVRMPVQGPTVDLVGFGGMAQIGAIVAGRGWYGLVVLLPMAVAAAYGAALGRGRPIRRIPAAVVIAAFIGFAVVLGWPASTAPIVDADGQPVPGSIAELTTVRLGGQEQALLVRGRSTTNPVLLYLVGGPGGSQLGHVRATMEHLEDDFVLVVWEQRGTGTSYPALDPTETHTLDQAVADTLELTNHLRERFGQERIYLLGNSWGTVPGVLAVRQHPELFYAFIGAGQMVSIAETDRRFHAELLDYAARTGDNNLAAELDGYGEPPYADVVATQNVALHYSSLLMPPPTMSLPGPDGLGASEYNLVAKRNAVAGLIDTYAIMYPQLQELDFRRDVTRLDVPVYVVQGEDEAPGRDDLVREWFATLSAPSKTLFTLPGADHMPNYQAPEEFAAVMAQVLADTGPQPEFGFIRAIDLATGSLEVDRAQWLTGRTAVEAAVADGEAPPGTTDMPNGFYLRNPDPRTVTVQLDDGVTVTMSPLYGPGDTEQVRIDLTTFAALWADGAPPEHRSFRDAPYHLTFTEGKVTSITEQYVP